MQDIDIQEKLGSGSYGQVFKAYDRTKKEYRAVKVFRDEYSSIKEWMDDNEVKIMTKIKHKNLVRLKKVIYEGNKLWLVMELCEKSLSELFRERSNSGIVFTEQEIKSYMKDILEGTMCLHSHGYIHRDLKPENILLSKDNILKLADFGTIKNVKDNLPFTNYVSTRWYRAPEWILEVDKYNEKVDVFALGWIMAEFYRLKPLFCGSSSKDQLTKYLNTLGGDQIIEWPEANLLIKKYWINPSVYGSSKLSKSLPNVSAEAFDLINDMLSLDPKNRPTVKEILNHPYFSQNYKNSRNLERSEFEVKQEDSEKNMIRNKIKKNLLKKVDALHKLDLSKVPETDRESSIDISPSHKNYLFKKNGVKNNSQTKFSLNINKQPILRRNKSNFSKNDLILGEPKLIANTQVNQIKNEEDIKTTKNRIDNNTSNNFGIIRNSRRADSTPNSQGFKLKSSYNPLLPLLKNESQRRLEIDENSLMNSIKSKDSSSSRRKTVNANKYDSSSEDYDTLKSEVDKQNSKSLPISMKNIPMLHFQITSRDSERGESIKNKNTIDRYFTDINGNSIISTTNASNDLFGGISSTNLSQRNSLLSGSKSNRGINAEIWSSIDPFVI